jgi:hypothetical protein
VAENTCSNSACKESGTLVEAPSLQMLIARSS